MKKSYACVTLIIVATLTWGCARKEEPQPPIPEPTRPTEPVAVPVTPTATCAPTRSSRIQVATVAAPATEQTVNEARARVAAQAQESRAQWSGKTFEEFEQSVMKECFEGGKYIVSGDIAIADIKQLKEFFSESIQRPAAAKEDGSVGGKLIINTAGGQDTAWNQQQKTQLKYCVSTAFGDRHADVVRDMAAATKAWEDVAKIDYIHDPAQDSNCTAANAAVVFDVRPVDVGGDYLARAFFPDDARPARNILIDASALDLEPGSLTLAGILRHELGHTLGWRHEHTRPEAGACFEDTNWRPISTYDTFSVMHYPQCNGGGDWKLELTAKDKSGAACIYGPAAGFTIDTGVCTPLSQIPDGAGAQKTERFVAQTVALGGRNHYGPFNAKPGTSLVVSTTPSGTAAGDPDLYVRFGSQKPETTLGRFNCRPYLTGAAETCDLTVRTPPRNAARVMVHGYTAGAYDLTVTFVPNTP